MKSHATTLVAALFALILTAFVAILPCVPFFAAGEALTGDKMMQLRHRLAPHPPDQHLIFVPIDAITVKNIGNWPIPRRNHAILLQDLAQEKPKVVGWDIFFVDPTPVDTAAAPDSSPPASTIDTTTQNQPATSPPNPPPPSPATTISAPDASGINSTTTSSPSSTPTPQVSTPTAPASVPDALNPPAALPAPLAANDSPSSAISLDDQKLAYGASLFTNMVTCADRDDSGPPLNNKDFLPTRPLKQVHGDPSHLLFSNSAELPIPILLKESYFGFADQDTSSDTRRTTPLVVDIAGKILPSFDLQVLLQYWDIDPDKVVVNIGHEIVLPLPDGTQTRIPIDDQGFININYRVQTGDFKGKDKGEDYFGVIQGLEDKAAGQQSHERSQLPPIKGNIILVGVDLTGTDQVVTPLESVAPGIITHLNVLNNILQSDFLHPVSPLIWLPVYAVFLFVSGNLMFRIGIVPLIPIGLVAIALQVATSYIALWLGNYQVPTAGPALGLLLLCCIVPTRRFWGEEREKNRLRSAMRAHLSEKVMSKILAHPDGSKLGGVKQEITIMFCDIRGFTKYCDNRDSGEVLQVLNEYMEEMTQVVFKYDGTVDKYIGDCIMAFWNAPDAQPDHAQRAVCCAMEMRYALANFKTRRAGKDTELFECGIGIHTGEALVGNMGSTLKLNYTAMGSTVNLASRLESLTKRLNERILISEDTLKQLQGDFPLTDRGEAVVPGFANPIHVYAVVADQDIVSALKVGRTLADQQEYTAEEASEPIWKPAPLPKDTDLN